MKKTILPLILMLISLAAQSQNPLLLKDIFPGSTGSSIQEIVKTSNYTFFNAEDDDADTDRGLYRTDGTPAGTIKLNLSYVPDLPPSVNNYASTKAEKLTALGNKIIFAGDNIANYGEIWSSDGTQAGTIALERFQPSLTGVKPIMDIAALGNNVLYGVVNSSNRSLLKKTDGTPGGTSIVYDFSSQNRMVDLALFKTINNILYFNLYDIAGTGFDQLWRSDGTTGGTYMVKDFGADHYTASFYMNAGSFFYIMLVQPGTGNVLWKSDGTAAGTVALKTIGTTGNNYYPQNVAIGSTLYFSGLDANGMELWKTDGTAAGTVRTADINAGAGSSNPASLTVMNNVLYFSADNGTIGRELYRSSGSSSILVRDILPGTGGSNVSSIIVSNNTLLFRASNGINGAELWISDGSFANTRQVAEINPAGDANPTQFTPGNPVYFSADNGTNGREIFKYDNSGGLSTGVTFQTIYVNDNSTSGDILTTATGNNANPGTPEAPVATITHALSIAQPGFTIVVDAGTYTEQLNIDKAITIRGAGRALTFLNGPAAPISTLADFAEKGIIQSLAGIGDVNIDRISIDGSQSDEVHAILIQGGGSVRNCEIKNANNGIFFRYSGTTTIRSANASNNSIHDVSYAGINFAGTKLNSFAFSNTINLAGSTFGMAIIAGFDFGALPFFSFEQNTVSNFNGWGVNANCLTGSVINNSITGTAGFHLTGSGYAATCNWLGSADKTFVQTKVSGNILFSPWLANGVDNSPAFEGFQPISGVCTGSLGEFYVNDNVTTGDKFTSAIGNDANNGSAALPFATITKALNTAQVGDLIYVDAGNYPQTLTTQNLSRAVTLLGANHDINPNSNTNLLIENISRNTESIISGTTYNIGASNIIIKGFTISPGGRSAITLTNTGATNNDFGNVNLSNNRFIISSGSTLLPITGKFVASPSMPVTSGYNISNNRFLKTDPALTQAIQVSYIKNSTIDGNAFPAPTALYTVMPINLGASGIVDNISFSGNAVDKGWYNMFTQRVANAVIANNKFNSRNGMSFNNFAAESSHVIIRDNEFNETLSSSVVAYVTMGTKLPLSTTNVSITGNTYNFDATGNTTSPLSLLGVFLDNTVVNSTVLVNNNKVNITGSFASSPSTATSAIRIGGKIISSSISNNELIYSATGAIPPLSPAVPHSGILVITEGNAFQGILPVNAVMNVMNNKIDGFHTSVVLYDGGTTIDAYQGAGNLANGATVNVTNNSFTNDFLSINSGEIGQPVNANCNWYGSSLSSDITPKITPLTVIHKPWLTFGGDQNIATGFQPLGGSCNGGQTKFFVNDNSVVGDVFTTAIGNNANPGTSTAPLATIAYATLTAKAGDTIIVDAGTFAERIFVNKALTYKGAFAGVNPGTYLNRGLSETILLPATENNISEIITVQSANVSFDGFLFDGDNPSIAGTLTLNGVDINAGMGIFNGNLQTDNLAIKNNIFKNFHRYGMLLQRTTGTLIGNVITTNHIDNVSSRSPRDGRAVGLFNNAYATVTNNHLTRVNTGVFIASFNVGSTDSVLIDGNIIEAYSFGITSSNHTNLTSSFAIKNNVISVANLTTWNAPGSSPANTATGVNMGFAGSTKNLWIENNNISGMRSGIGVSQFTSQGQLLLSNNIVTGSQTGMQLASIKTTPPVLVKGGSISNSSQLGFFYIGNGTSADKLKMDNVSLANNVVNVDVSAVGGNLLMEFADVSVVGGTTGIRFSGTQLSLAGNALSGVSFSNQTKEYILQTSNAFQGQIIDASTTTFDGLTAMQMTLPQLFATEDKLTHQIDFDGVGYFKLKQAEVFVTKNSFAATLPPVFGSPTFSPNINRAVGAAISGDVIHVGEGVYTNQVIIDKAITLKGAGMGLTTIQMPPLPHIAAFTAPGFGSEYGVIQSTENITGDVNIEQLTVDGVNQTFFNNAHGIIIQTSGNVSNCEVKNMRNPILNQTYQTGNGIFGRYNGAAPKSLTFNGNKVSGFHYNGLLAFGSSLSVNMINNQIDGTGGLYSMGINTNGLNGGVQSLNVSNNTISGFTGFGLGITGNTPAIIHDNSITGTAGLAINNSGTAEFTATCNWFGATNFAAVSSKINGSVSYSPWLTNGTDTDAATGFQPVANSCNGVPVDADIVLVTNVTCNEAVNGSIDVLVKQGIAPFTYAWSKDNVAGFSTDEDLVNLAPGFYKLFVTDANGSLDSVFTVITEPDVLTGATTGTNNICFGAAAGTAEVSATGGTLPYSYLWSNGAATDNTNNLTAGVYSATVTDANGCAVIANYTVTQPTQLTAAATGVSTACSNSASVLASGGTGGFSYLWSNGAITTSINNIASGTYSVTVTDENKCTAITSVTVTGSEAFNPSAQVTNVSCFGTLTGSLTVTNANGQAPFRYSKDGINYQPSNIFNGLAAGNYTISVVDAIGCAGFVDKTITQPTALIVVLNTVQPTCSAAATGSITVTATGGSGSYSYNWVSTGYTATQRNIGNLAAGNYKLTVTDNNGCATMLDVSVTSFAPIVITEVIANIACKAQTNGSIDLSVTGGTGAGFTYLWNTGGVIQDLTNLGVGNFSVTVTDIGSGCTVSRNYTITQPASLVSISTTKTNATGCAALGSISIAGSGGTGPYTYSRDGVTFGSTNSYNNLYAGNYTVWVKDANGCSKSALIIITDNGSDQFEGNNSKTQAKQIPIGTPSFARLAIAADVADWFKITTPAGGAQYTLAVSHPTVSYTFNLFAAGNNSPALIPVSGAPGYKTYNLTGNTTYFISMTGGLSFNCYQVSVTTIPISRSGFVADEIVAKEDLFISEKLASLVFPNPHQGNFTMEIRSPEQGKARIEFFTVSGQKIVERTVFVQRGNNLVPFTAMPAGSVFYRIQVGSLKANGKIIGLK